MFGRNKIAMLVAEFFGTAFLTAVILGVQRSTLGLPYFIALAGGIAVAYGMYAFGSVSGGQFNPALTIALWTARRVKTTAAILYIAVQLLGGWAAYAMYHYFVNTQVQAIHTSFSSRLLIAEAVGALIFGFGWAAAAYNRFENNKFATAAGLSFALGILIASAGSTAAVVNPAVALGTRDWAWLTSVLGPVLGAVIGVNLYGLLFAPVEAVVAPVLVEDSTTTVRSRSATAARPVRTRATTVKKTAVKKRRTTKR
jgi:glycerol uptake facilitator-like aquaporin